MADAADVRPERRCEIPADNLRVVEVHLHFEMARADLFAYRMRLVLAVEEEARDVAGVDRLDEELSAKRCGALYGGSKIVDVSLLMTLPVGIVWHSAGKDVQPRRSEAIGVLEREIDAREEVLLAARDRSASAFPGFPIAGRGIEEDVLEPVVGQPAGDVLRRKLVGKEKLDCRESSACRAFETFGEGDLREHHRKVGGEARHALV